VKDKYEELTLITGLTSLDGNDLSTHHARYFARLGLSRTFGILVFARRVPA
jgi:hypothetical protein